MAPKFSSKKSVMYVYERFLHCVLCTVIVTMAAIVHKCGSNT